MKKNYIAPIVVLMAICLFISGALAVSNSITEPIIAAAAAERAETARKSILPTAAGFELMDIENFRSDGSISKRITEVYRTTNNVGYIFMITTAGYGGDIKLICGVDPNGKIINTATLSQTETQGLGTPVFAEAHAGQYKGRDRSGAETVSVISGATITSVAFRNGIIDALAAFETVRAR